MYSLNKVKTLVSCGRDPARSLPLWRGFLLIPLILVCFALSPRAQATCQDGCNNSFFNVFQGDDALSNDLSGPGVGNSAFGWRALNADTTGSFNTGLGGGALILNNANSNTAVGAAALLLNTVGTGADTGTENVAVGTDAMVFNSGGVNEGEGSFNDAVGAFALFGNVTGFSNNAFGNRALENNINGASNTAVGDLALNSNGVGGSTKASGNTAVGAGALFANDDGDSNNAVGFNALTNSVGGSQNNGMGFGVLGSSVDGAANTAMGDSAFGDDAHGSFNTVIGWDAGGGVEGDDNIYIGATAGLPGGGSEAGMIRIGDPDFINACFVAGITGVGVTGDPVFVTTDGQLGVAAAGSPLSAKELTKTHQVVQQLKATTEKQAAVIALQEAQIKSLTAALKEQATQIQKVSAQLEMIRPAPRMVGNQ
jgi:hypothetical protein